MGESLLPDRRRIRGHAWCLGERIDVRSLERGHALDLTPPTLRAGNGGLAVLFRYGAVGGFERDPIQEATFHASLEGFVKGRFPEPEGEEVGVAIKPGCDERPDAEGTIWLGEASLEPSSTCSTTGAACASRGTS